jgi:hypothetical protein
MQSNMPTTDSNPNQMRTSNVAVAGASEGVAVAGASEGVAVSGPPPSYGAIQDVRDSGNITRL